MRPAVGAQPPAWCIPQTPTRTESMAGLGPGETEAILIAEELKADLLLLDDAKARKTALQRGLAIAGTLALLAKAAQANLLDLPTALAALQQTTFHVSPGVLAKLGALPNP